MKKNILLMCLLVLLLAGCGAHQPNSVQTDTPPEVSQPSEPASTDPVPTAPVPSAPMIKVETADLATEEMKRIGNILTLDKISVEGANCEALGDSLRELNQEMETEIMDLCDGGAWQHAGCTVRYEAQVRRSDEEIVSIYYSIYEETGSTEPYLHGRSANFEAQSGKRLSELEALPGLGIELDWGTALNRGIYSALSWELRQAADEYMLDRGAFPLADSYQELLTECFWYEDAQPAWTVEEDGIRFVFQPGTVAPWEAGQPTVTVDYDYATGKLGSKYYPDRDTLLQELAGEWVKVATEVEGDISFPASLGSREILTIELDGNAVLRESRWENGRLETLSTTEMTLTLADGGLWDFFPALNHLEYQLPGFDDGFVGYSFALDGDRLYVWFVNDIEYIASVACYYRADDPERLFPRCLEGSWIIHSVESPYIGIEYPGPNSDQYVELEFQQENWDDAVPVMHWIGYAGERSVVTPELHGQRLEADRGPNWFLTFDEDYGDGMSSSYTIVMENEDLLRVEEHFRQAADALPTVSVLTFWREGTAAEAP